VCFSAENAYTRRRLMTILATSRHPPRYLSHCDVAIVGDILQHDVAIVEKSGDRKDALEKESDGNGDVVSPWSVSFSSLFFTLRFLSFLPEVKKGGCCNYTLPTKLIHMY